MAKFEYAVKDSYGDLMERSCGCPRVFPSIEQATIYAEFANDGMVIVSRVVSDWGRVTS